MPSMPKSPSPFAAVTATLFGRPESAFDKQGSDPPYADDGSSEDYDSERRIATVVEGPWRCPSLYPPTHLQQLHPAVKHGCKGWIHAPPKPSHANRAIVHEHACTHA